MVNPELNPGKPKTQYPVFITRWKDIVSNPWLQMSLTAILVVGLIVAVLSINLLPRKVEVEIGQPSKIDIEAQRDITNRPRTLALQESAGKQAIKDATAAPQNYDISPAASINVEDTIDKIFDKILATRKLYSSVNTPGPPSQGSQLGYPGDIRRIAADLSDEIRKDTGIEVPATSLVVLLRASQAELESLRATSRQVAGSTMRETRISRENIPEAKASARKRLADAGISGDLLSAALAIVEPQIGPNLVLNPTKVEKARQDAIASVEPVMILKGQTVVRRGEIVTAEHIEILKDLGLLGSKVNYLGIIGITAVSFIFTGIIATYLYQFRRDILLDIRLFSLLGSLIVIVVGIIAIISSIPWSYSSMLIPTAFGSMLIAVIFDPRLAIITSIVFGLIAGILGGNYLGCTLVSTITAIAAAFTVSKVGERSDLVRAGFIVGAVNSVAIAGVGLIFQNPDWVAHSYLGLGNGVLSTILAVGILPFFENLFHITTSIRLLELSNPNRPLLKRLLIEAPGTYHHSIIVGNLAEAAASAIGADTLLVRAGAYYHDIGKTKRPYFFVENQLVQDNPHDKISPSLSALVILSHVKDGVELARSHRLPQSLIDIIMQHHGTTLVKYFYHKAQESSEDGMPDESDFRYPGPRPQTREAAIVMLADCVEAGVRSLSRPTPGRIEGFVRKMIKDLLASGQLDQCDLTFRDLDEVAKAFVRILTGIFHPRIEYPSSPTVKGRGES
ncbi:MAG TPA: HDIG domain-containing protein [Firmicutes bacterium]|nr:HDIG domain-containing protein [Bacillota bacterium]HHY99343.1 HDIG domain-containing protein [Bacillota bacterium]